MRRLLVFLLGTVGVLCGAARDSHAQEDSPSRGRPVVIPRAAQFDLRSKSGVDYRIFVAGPTGPVPEAGAPVIYFSDGNANFPLILGAAQRQVREAIPCVVVGIGYAADDPQEIRKLRSVDLTPPTSAEWAAAHAKPFADLPTGGNDRFLDFIEQELKPVIEQKYKIDRRRQTLFGHSFGGLFVLHTLFTRPESFQTYIATSPTIWWNDGSIRQDEERFLERFRGKALPARLLLMVGEQEQPPMTRRAPGVRPGPPGRAVDSLQELASRLAAAKLHGLVVETRVFAEEHHGSVVLPAASRGVRFALEDKRQ